MFPRLRSSSVHRDHPATQRVYTGIDDMGDDSTVGARIALEQLCKFEG
jgi:hypothetical protein